MNFIFPLVPPDKDIMFGLASRSEGISLDLPSIASYISSALRQNFNPGILHSAKAAFGWMVSQASLISDSAAL